jgi:hypothetical protein
VIAGPPLHPGDVERFFLLLFWIVDPDGNSVDVCQKS